MGYIHFRAKTALISAFAWVPGSLPPSPHTEESLTKARVRTLHLSQDLNSLDFAADKKAAVRSGGF